MGIKPYPRNTDYLVDSDGAVYGWYKGRQKRRLLKPYTNPKTGYAELALIIAGKRTKTTLHRVVAETFLDNPDSLPDVNHKDENKLNNSVDNLEYISHKENCNYGTIRERQRKSQKERYERYRITKEVIERIDNIERRLQRIEDMISALG